MVSTYVRFKLDVDLSLFGGVSLIVVVSRLNVRDVLSIRLTSSIFDGEKIVYNGNLICYFRNESIVRV